MRSQTTSPPESNSPKLLRILFAAAALITTLLVGLLIFEMTYGERVLPGTRVWGLDLSGMTVDVAADALDHKFAYLDESIITLNAFGRSWNVTPNDFGARLDTQATARAAYRHGRGGSAFGALSQQFDMLMRGVDVAPLVTLDLNKAQAYLDTLSDELNIEPRDAHVSLDGFNVVVTPSQSGRLLDRSATLNTLFEAAQMLQPVGVDLVFFERPATITDGSAAANKLYTLISQPFTLYLEQPRADDLASAWDMTLDQLASLSRVRISADGTALQIELDRDELTHDLSQLANQIRREAQNARFVFNDTTRELEAITSSVDGRELDIDATLAGINAAIELGLHRAPMVVHETPADFKEGLSAQELGITENVVTQRTYFAGSPDARMTNIEVAAARLHGVIVKPDDVFSLAAFLGDISLDEGYAEALIIANGRTIQGVGGGVCQVSTTMFRSAFFGGYPIIERWPHAYRVGWYEKGFGAGLDATVYVPQVDFKFKNDTPYHLLIETYTDKRKGELTFKFYSTSDGREVTIGDPIIENVKPHGPAIYEVDATLAAGEIKQVDYAIDGADVTVQRTVMRDGVLLSQDTIFTRYHAWQAVYHVGPETSISGN